MKPAQDIVPVADNGAPRRPWKAPIARRLVTSAAETGGTVNFDGIEQLS